MNDTIQLSGLARQLVLHELLDEKAAQQAQSQAQRNKLSLVTYLVQSKLVKGQALVRMTAQHNGIV
ncbi:type IV-A pilus assembly ATPase PilB, partial [Pseudomonas aeruginosa]